MKQVNEL